MSHCYTFHGLSFLTLLALLARCSSFLYQPASGSVWDPSVIYWEGNFHAFFMYAPPSNNSLSRGNSPYTSGFEARSHDGVHWDDVGPIAPESPGDQWFKCFVRRVGHSSFVMDHGVDRPVGQDTMRFLRSEDLVHWELLSSSHPDPMWYNTEESQEGGVRWDHMYVSEDAESGGYVGFVVAVPSPPLPPSPGVMRSKDGFSWEVHPPLNITWEGSGVKEPFLFEEGGFERIGERFYLIGGRGLVQDSRGYSMWVFSSPRIDGPYTPDTDAFRLCGTSDYGWILTGLAAWCRGDGGELLISNYIIPSDPGDVWLLPLRKPVVDSRGFLHLGWWRGNEALKGKRIDGLQGSIGIRGGGGGKGVYHTAWLQERLGHRPGVLLSGNIAARGGSRGNESDSVGFAIRSGNSTNVTLVLLSTCDEESSISEECTTRIGNLTAGGAFDALDVTRPQDATVSYLSPGVGHSFVLMARLGMFELYLDDLLVQSFLYSYEGAIEPSSPLLVGVATSPVASSDVSVEVDGLVGWEMSLL